MHEETSIRARSAAPTTSTGQRGFLLLDVLVAFMIGALAIGVLYEAALTGLYSTTVASHYEQALSRARSRIAIAAHGGPPVAGEQRGDDGGGFSWRLLVAPIATTAMPPVSVVTRAGAPSTPITLYAITVWISWRDNGGRRSVRLDTQQIGQVPG
jgi:general secretion pathway protein I